VVQLQVVIPCLHDVDVFWQMSACGKSKWCRGCKCCSQPAAAAAAAAAEQHPVLAEATTCVLFKLLLPTVHTLMLSLL
jgi:hypothetical protein